MNYRAYIRLLRPKHYLKNMLVFLPLMFGGYLFDAHFLFRAVGAFISFSLVASAVYIINDINDRKVDSLHPKKRHRSIASGAVSVPIASTIAALLLVAAGAMQYCAHVTLASVGLLAFYFFINVLYSFGLKNIPIVDVTVLSLGFVVRVLYGGYAVGIEVSKWLYLAILAFSFYLGLGKRRNEIRANGHVTRKVNKYYTVDFLDKNMYVCLGLTVVYYSLWAVDPAQIHKLMYWTIPLFIMIIMTYSLAVERPDSDGDPVGVLFGNRALFGLVIAYVICTVGIVYF